MLEDFESRTVTTEGAEIFLKTGGSGPPLLMLHGYPQTHITWRLVAPLLAEHFTLVLPDLRGYGQSRGPAPDAENQHYSKRTMAADMVTVMLALGHERFLLAGHDRGGRVAYRLCLDHPERVSAFAAIDVAPTIAVWEGMNAEAALDAWHWPFLAQPAAVAEPVIAAATEAVIGSFLRGWAGKPDGLTPEAIAAYLAQFEDPAVIAGTCADYRAGATIDWRHDAEDRAKGRRIACPILAHWGSLYLGEAEPTPVTNWKAWADEVTGGPFPCGHFLQEELPEVLAEALIPFFLANRP
ncbi:MAG: alpha/beta hydrolase [Pseudomonadota bacterium]